MRQSRGSHVWEQCSVDSVNTIYHRAWQVLEPLRQLYVAQHGGGFVLGYSSYTACAMEAVLLIQHDQQRRIGSNETSFPPMKLVRHRGTIACTSNTHSLSERQPDFDRRLYDRS